MTQYEVAKGDLLVSRANTRELLASVCIVPAVRPRLLLCDKLFRLVPTAGIENRFLAYALTTSDARRKIESEATGTSDSMQNVGQDSIRELKVWLPANRVQQVAIADEADRQLGEVIRLDLALDHQIGRLRERRQWLVTAAVAGQLQIAGVVQ
jgi:type I restriction enzyme S subunit